MEDPPTSDPVPLSTSVLTTLLLQQLKSRFDDSTLVATEVLVNMNILSETATVQGALPERGLYHIANDCADFEHCLRVLAHDNALTMQECKLLFARYIPTNR